MQLNELTSEEKRVIEGKGTEAPYSGEYDDFYPPEGIFICKRCNSPLFDAKYKFKSGCGWPSFDEFFEDAVKETPDADGMRTEITCNTCGAHLGHVFRGEQLTDKNTRHCVNSLSIKFVADEQAKEA
jgi:peptide-methionine (R)-S-oxide reductase